MKINNRKIQKMFLIFTLVFSPIAIYATIREYNNHMIFWFTTHPLFIIVFFGALYKLIKQYKTKSKENELE